MFTLIEVDKIKQIADHYKLEHQLGKALEELSELIDFSKISESLFAYTSLAAIQRLGFILDVVLQEEQRANDLYDLLCKYTRTFKYVFLSTRHSADVQEKNTRWKIKINTNIEVDDI